MRLSGFHNHHQTEAIPNALPTNQNSPQICPMGLFAEQLSGTAFCRPRSVNLHSWLYRQRPSVVHSDYKPYSSQFTTAHIPIQAPNPMRWSAWETSVSPVDFIDGLRCIAHNQHASIHLYQCNLSMHHRYFNNHDGDLLFVPYQGKIQLHTEFGSLTIEPKLIAVIPRGIAFRVELMDECAAGYLCENHGAPFTLPELGPLGANGLANPRHFLYPTAAFESINHPVHLVCKHQNALWIASSPHSPLNVVAWHGNYAPYCYDLMLFNTINTVSFDHPDPSIFTVLTSLDDAPGASNLDFVVFPPRWMVAEHTFRPPYFHRNVMSEFMGLISGQYDGKASGFDVGGFSIHNAMVAHGPDVASYQKACEDLQKPNYYSNTFAFMFESSKRWLVTDLADHHSSKQTNYSECWQGFA